MLIDQELSNQFFLFEEDENSEIPLEESGYDSFENDGDEEEEDDDDDLAEDDM